MPELKYQTLLLISIYGLPGFLFLKAIAANAFGATRPSAGKAYLFVLAFIFSTISVLIYDCIGANAFLAKLLTPYLTQPLTQKWATVVDFLSTQPLFPTLSQVLIFEKPVTQIDLRVLFFIIIGPLTIIATLLGLVISRVIHFTMWLQNIDHEQLKFIIITKLFHYVLGPLLPRKAAFIRRPKSRPIPHVDTVELLKVIGRKEKSLWRWLKKAAFLLKMIVVRALIHILGFVSSSLSHFAIIMAKALGFVLWPVREFIALFRHPYEELFVPKTRPCHAIIVEVLVDKNTLNKGEFVSLKSKDSDEISSITLRNIIQYKKKDDDLFTRETRLVHVFHRSKSELTIPIKKIDNFNVTSLSYESFRWDFQITSEAMLENQVWYLRVLLPKNLSRFSVLDLKPEVDINFAVRFLYEVMDLAYEAYSAKPEYHAHLAMAFGQALLILQPLHKLYKTNKGAFDIEGLARTELYLSKFSRLLRRAQKTVKGRG